MKKVDQKTILILGGTKHMINLVETARRMGISPIVVDDVTASPAKKYADKSFDTSTSNIEGLIKIVQAEKVKGVFAAFEDINTWNALALCKKMDLPFYMIEEQLKISSNKYKFKAICRRFAVPVIEEKELTLTVEEKAVAMWEFPVINKPFDSYIRKEIAICYGQEEDKEGLAKEVDLSHY